MRLWRVVLPHRADEALSGEGARRFGGRWNRPGQPAIYTASTASLAVLEWLVNVDPGDGPDELVALAYDLPDEESITRYDRSMLPRGWRRYPVPEPVRQIGVDWLEACTTVALAVPSAVLPLADEHNVVLNPVHPGVARLTEARRERIAIDPRLLDEYR